MFRGRISLIAVLVAFFFVFGCAPKFEKMAPKEIFDYGEKKFNKKSYSDALGAYEALIENYPFSIYVTQAELRIADAYYARHLYEQSVEAYEDFMEKHPTNDSYPHALHHLGLSHYKLKLAIDRDQGETQAAEKSLSGLVTKYPDYKDFLDAKEKLRIVRKDLAARERYVARFYYREKEFYAAYKRYERVVRDYNDTPYYQEALYYSGLCLRKLDESEEAKRYFQQLVTQFPDHKYSKKARGYLNEGS